MVVFTCNNCGETLQKPRVTKHYQFRCHDTPNLTCVDCLKDFRGQEYVEHTKCMTEAERYGGKNYVPKPGTNKGERKQQAWVNVVHNLLDISTDLSNAEKNFLQGLLKFENIPRKKGKFLNFIRNAYGYKVNLPLVESVWTKMELAQEKMLGSATKCRNDNGDSNENVENSSSVHQENNIVENQNNENICKEGNVGNERNINDKLFNNNCIQSAKEETLKKAKKSKKRGLSASAKNADESPIAEKRCKNASEFVSVLSESNQHETTTKSPFDWKTTILNVVTSKGEVTLKKLQKKVFSQYINYYSDAAVHDKFLNKFNKKLNKLSEVTVSDEKVRLA